MYSVVLYIGYRCICCVLHQVQVYVSCCTLSVGACVVMYIVYVYVIEEKKRHWVLLGVEIDPVCI